MQSGDSVSRSMKHALYLMVSAFVDGELTLVGVGYRAKAQGTTLDLTLGFSHPVKYAVPEGINAGEGLPVEQSHRKIQNGETVYERFSR